MQDIFRYHNIDLDVTNTLVTRKCILGFLENTFFVYMSYDQTANNDFPLYAAKPNS